MSTHFLPLHSNTHKICSSNIVDASMSRDCGWQRLAVVGASYTQLKPILLYMFAVIQGFRTKAINVGVEVVVAQ